MEKFIRTRHNLIFTVISALGFEIIAYSLSFGISAYTISCIIFLAIFVFEAALSLKLAKEMRSKMPLPHLVDDVKHIHISHHIFLPVALYASICAYIFFNGMGISSEMVIILGTITFYSIFAGKRSSFKNEFLFNETLHYIYDSIKIIIYFLGIDVIIQAQGYFNFSPVITYAVAQLLAFILLLLMIARKDQFNSAGILYMFIASLIPSAVVIILLPHLSAIAIALISSVAFYILVGIMHHKINATLTLSIALEYILIAVILLLALKGIY